MGDKNDDHLQCRVAAADVLAPQSRSESRSVGNDETTLSATMAFFECRVAAAKRASSAKTEARAEGAAGDGNFWRGERTSKPTTTKQKQVCFFSEPQQMF
jgi:hypothetical protein